MADTFGAMTRELRLWVPGLPIYLAKKLIRDRYRQISEMRGWSALRAESEFIVEGAYSTGTVTVTRNSATVVGAGTSWTAGHVGRQFMVSARAPVYSVLSVESGTSLTLDRPYGGVTAAGANYRLLQAYVTAPADFKRFVTVLDPEQTVRLRHWVTQDEVSKWDPARTTFGQPWVLADRRFGPTGVPQFELWPYTITPRNYPFYYIKQAADLVDDDDEPFYPLRGPELVRGALADLAKWPGTKDHPNPMFGRAVELSRAWDNDYRELLDNIEREDESIYMTWLSETDWSSWPVAPLDAKFLQNHA